MFDLYLTLISMLTSLEYLLPLCGVYCMVIISVDRWTNWWQEFGEQIPFFSVLIETGCIGGEKNKEIYQWCSVHRSPQPQSPLRT